MNEQPTTETWRLERLEAVIQTAILGAYADGRLAEQERYILRECIVTYAESEADAKDLLAFAMSLPSESPRLTSKQRALRVSEIKRVLVTRRERESAYRLAVAVTDAHEGINVRESAALLQMMFDLEIDGEVARKLLKETAKNSHLHRKAVGRVLRPEGAAPKSLAAISPLPKTGEGLEQTLRSKTETDRVRP